MDVEIQKYNDYGFDEFSRPHVDLSSMNMCFDVNIKSLDPSTKHGTIVISQDGTPLSWGYNSPIRGADDKNIPLTRPEKYPFFQHSELNSIFNAARTGTSLKNSVFYVTGMPCIGCLSGIIQVGASRVVYGPLNSIMLDNEKEKLRKQYELLLRNQPIKIEKFKYLKGLYVLKPFLKEMFEKRGCLDMPDFI